MSDAVHAFGTLLKRGDGGSPETFTSVAEVRSINGVNLTRDTSDVTHHESTGKWEEVIVGIKRSGQLTAEVNYLPGNATQNGSAGVLKDFNDGTKRNWEMVLTDASNLKWSFAAFVTGFATAAPRDGELIGTITLKLTGQVTIP